MPSGFPVLAEITIEEGLVSLLQFERRHTPVARIVGNDDPHDGWLIVLVAGVDDEMRDRLEDGWA